MPRMRKEGRFDLREGDRLTENCSKLLGLESPEGSEPKVNDPCPSYRGAKTIWRSGT